MTESFVTQCPKCRTSFRVSLAQLGIAQGAVRCGACLQVFNAARQLREQGHHVPDVRPAVAPPAARVEAPPAAAAPTPPAAKPAPRIDDDTLWIHDDLDLDDLDLDEELAKLEAQEQQLSQQFLELDQATRQPNRFQPTAGSDDDVDDERWAEALLRDEPPPAPLALEPVHKAEPARLPPIPDTPGIRHFDNPPPPAEEPEPDAEPEPHFSLSAQRDDEPFDDQAEDAEPAPEAPLKPGARQARRSEPNLRDEHLFDLEEEPLQLDWQAPRKPWGRWIGWGLLNLIAASALAGQYVIYHFAELARQDQYRPWFEQACPVLGCELPSKVDIQQIRSSNLVVRSHPEFSGALVVDAILYNRAAFSQPFPLLEMRFADLNGQLIASRRFKPSEYLAGELAGQAEMPPQTPIHIALDILDPGVRAVNYSLNFHSPE
ncbi:DUF3426 domain-containing protein [Phytopseudomonas dryadis]|uniref:DUF3426 domain-containing protein n=1 Tax=Phytopseudomonas dryadis TaxID=2487520 RepID=A0A4Q9R9E5_9GAMM|nr:DUF3426 domain-containing protein [Pseudomonas dryadis]TBU97153.1 DUF3426 domain-containing protein [Pseudomonas dryadis]